MSSNTVCDPEPNPQRWLILALVCAGTFMATLDVSIVNVALPTLTASFRTTVATSQWFVLIYTFVITILLMTFGRLGDITGRRRLYIAGILIFAAGSLVCGLSVSALMLIAARAFQAVGSAITMSSGPALVTEAFPSRERGKALGFVGTAVALGLLTGPIAGGLLVQYASWRWMFFINVPIGLALSGLVAARIGGFDTARGGRLDIPGAALMALALAALVLGLTYGNGLGWGSPSTIALFTLALGFGASFGLMEGRRKDPMLDLALFRNREFSIGAIAGWANYAATIPATVFLPFYLQNLLEYPPGQVGLVLAAGPVTLAIVSPIAGSLSDRIGSRFLTSAGLLTAAVGILALRTLGPDSTWPDVVWRLVLASAGSALFVSPNSSSIMGSVGCGSLGIASGAIALVRNLGMVCGIALAGAIITSTQKGFFATGEIAANPAVPHMAFLAGLKAALLACAAIAFFGAFISAMRVRPGDREAFERMG